MTTVIRVENLGKKYRIHHQQRERYTALRDVIANRAKSLFRNPQSAISNPQSIEDFWALKDVSFEIKQGEVVGIIGRNGAGKSTLLKVLSRITEPTTGRVAIKGRIASLLEVGTGFHPELTGRENIYLNGAILGMTKLEIQKKFDDIVSFAEIEKFLDTPVKRYSSGMYMRLAFSVAAHLEPEILLVDEVLAVGDASFQRKCLNKMQEVGQDGRTVIFVSHNMPAVTRLCEKAVLLNNGQKISEGEAQAVVSTYLCSGFGSSAIREWQDVAKAPGNENVRLIAVKVRDDKGAISENIDIRKPVKIEIEYEVLKNGFVLVPNFHFFNEDGLCLFVACDLEPEWKKKPKQIGHYQTTAIIPGNFLAEGTVIINVAISTMDPVIVHLHELDAVAFQVVDSLDGDSVRGDYAGPMPGVVRPALHWSTKRTTQVAKSVA